MWETVLITTLIVTRLINKFIALYSVRNFMSYLKKPVISH